ncbi:MAG TPA: FtsK/SpoIIIE domain-containing protein, partial [Acidimicrobiales bacterium]|nr:FtsK/SpoIIIE domain-containing protein [Acidimicrobiales bacterium]
LRAVPAATACALLWTAGHGQSAGLHWASLVVVVGGLAVAGWRAAERAVTWRHRREVLWPLAAAVHQLAGRHEHEPPGRYLHVPPDWTAPDSPPVTVRLAPSFGGQPGEQRLVETAIAHKLGASDLSYSWHLAGRRPHLSVRLRQQPPARATWADPAVRRLVERAAEPAPVIGVAAGGRPVCADLDAESPHVLISAATGGGKSVILRTLTAQLLHDGAAVAVVDVKRHSHRWARGIPGVTYLRDVEAIHHALVALRAEGERRNRLVDKYEGEDPPDLPRMVILLEEANATIGRLRRHWDRTRERGDPRTSPAIDALSDILMMGRAVRMHVLLVAQLATARALGGPEIREQFACRILARYTRNAWAMLAPEVSPPPPSTRHVGRAQVVLGGQATLTQVILMSDTEAREWAMSGVRPDEDLLPDLGPVTGVIAGIEPLEQGERPSNVTVLRPVPDDPEPAGGQVTLREAVEAGVLDLSLAAVRQARARDPEFPPPAGRQGQADTWRPADLTRWAANRPRQGAVR